MTDFAIGSKEIGSTRSFFVQFGFLFAAIWCADKISNSSPSRNSRASQAFRFRSVRDSPSGIAGTLTPAEASRIGWRPLHRSRHNRLSPSKTTPSSRLVSPALRLAQIAHGHH